MKQSENIISSLLFTLYIPYILVSNYHISNLSLPIFHFVTVIELSICIMIIIFSIIKISKIFLIISLTVLTLDRILMVVINILIIKFNLMILTINILSLFILTSVLSFLLYIINKNNMVTSINKLQINNYVKTNPFSSTSSDVNDTLF